LSGPRCGKRCAEEGQVQIVAEIFEIVHDLNQKEGVIPDGGNRGSPRPVFIADSWMIAPGTTISLPADSMSSPS